MRHGDAATGTGTTEAATAAGKGPSDHLRRLLRDGEDLAWRSKPHERAHYWATLVPGVPIVGFGVRFVGGFLQFVLSALAILLGVDALANIAEAVLPILGLSVSIGAAHLAARWRFDHAELGLTADRVIATSGIVGRDTSTLALADVRDVDVTVGLMDKLFGTGQVELQVAGDMTAGATFNYIDEPYEVMDTLEGARKKAEQRAQGA
jgi:uncharacterized membrane protein YdbT with pleckstrin-like domain